MSAGRSPKSVQSHCGIGPSFPPQHWDTGANLTKGACYETPRPLSVFACSYLQLHSVLHSCTTLISNFFPLAVDLCTSLLFFCQWCDQSLRDLHATCVIVSDPWWSIMEVSLNPFLHLWWISSSRLKKILNPISHRQIFKVRCSLGRSWLNWISHWFNLCLLGSDQINQLSVKMLKRWMRFVSPQQLSLYGTLSYAQHMYLWQRPWQLWLVETKSVLQP